MSKVLPPPAVRQSIAKIKDSTNYFQHQADGVRIMAKMTNALLADDMGLGKSLQALTVAAVDFEWGVASRVLVVCPSTLKWNWELEIYEHTNFTCMLLDGTVKKRERMLAEFAESDIDILIVNYEQVTSHLKELNQLKFHVIIYDEAHYLKNPKAKRTKACLDLVADRHLLLTGSPMLNQVDELWSLLHRMDPKRFPSYWRFVNRYAVMGGFKNKQIVGVKNRTELNEILAGYMIRRRKSEVLDLPEKQHITVVVDLHPDQKRIYKELKDDLKFQWNGITEVQIENVLTKVLYLKEICATTATVVDDGTDHSYKLDKVTEMVHELGNEGNRTVVFTQFREVIRCMERRMEQVNDLRRKQGKNIIPVYVITGDTPKQDRVATVEAWGHDELPGVVFVMLQVGGVGLNMTYASKCIFVDKLWTPKMNEQAEDRLHRIGADESQPIQIFQLLAKGTVEDRIEKALERKRKVFDTLVEESDWKKELVKTLMEEGYDE